MLLVQQCDSGTEVEVRMPASDGGVQAKVQGRMRGPRKSLMHFARDLELLVRHAYPEASEDMITVLLCSQFVDAIDYPQIRIYVQQAHPSDLQEALARGLQELESFLRATRERPSGNYVVLHKVKVRKGGVGTQPSSSPPPLEGFWENCYSCSQLGHSNKYCLQIKSSSKPGSAGGGH